jgi:glutamate racemase
LLRDTCPGLVQQIELGDLDSPKTRVILEHALNPMLSRKIDTVILACTHYPFVIPLIRQIVGENVRVIDPAPAVARQAKRLLDSEGCSRPGNTRGEIQFFTSGNASLLYSLLPKLLGESGSVKSVGWHGNVVTKEPVLFND